MRTNIEIDDELLEKAMSISKQTTKKGLINKLLSDYVTYQKRMEIFDLRGKVNWEGNLDEMRTYDKWDNR